MEGVVNGVDAIGVSSQMRLWLHVRVLTVEEKSGESSSPSPRVYDLVGEARCVQTS